MSDAAFPRSPEIEIGLSPAGGGAIWCAQMLPARAQMAAVLFLLAVLASGCRARSTFDEEGPVTLRIARLAPFERQATEPLPQPIERWLGDGASGLTAELVPPGLLTGGTPLPHWDASTATFVGFHVIESHNTSETLAREVIGWARDEAADGADDQGVPCMYPEFGLSVTRGGGSSSGAAPDARVLVSLACGQMRVFVAGEPPRDRGLSRRTRAHFAALMARAFRSAPS